MTVEIESILGNEELATLLEAAETSGQLRAAELQEIEQAVPADAAAGTAANLRSDASRFTSAMHLAALIVSS